MTLLGRKASSEIKMKPRGSLELVGGRTCLFPTGILEWAYFKSGGMLDLCQFRGKGFIINPGSGEISRELATGHVLYQGHTWFTYHCI